MTKTYYASRPLDYELYPLSGRQIIRIRKNITEEQTEDGSQFVCDEIESIIPLNTEITAGLILSLEEADRTKTANTVRQRRDELLEESDKRMVSDFPCNHKAWKTYRQALRDIPSQEGFPYDVVFPDIPKD